MGGRTEFFGPVVREPNEPVFHAPWEGRVFGMVLFAVTLLGRNIDALRFAQERLPRDVYLSGYYQRWLAGLESQLVRAGYVGPDEVDARIAGRVSLTDVRHTPRMRLAVTARLMSFLLRPSFPHWFAAHALPRLVGTSRPTLRGPRFAVGDHVRVRDGQTAGHTRCPGYVTGKPGVVVAHLGSTAFPDAHAVGRHARPQHLYTVSFDAGDLWGDAAEPEAEVRVDLYEAYLEPLEAA
jgi:nitrile hydratase